MSAPIRGAVRFRLRRRPFDRVLAARGFRQADLAAAAGVSRATVSRWRAGTLWVRGESALLLASLLGADFRELFAQEPPG